MKTLIGVLVVVAVSGVALSTGCGGGTPGAQSAASEPSEPQGGPDEPGFQMMAEQGGLDGDKVAYVFQKTGPKLARCWQKGAQRLESLGGKIAFYMKVGQDGRLTHAHAESSTLGDRATEKCMLDALRGRAWPKPVGGEVGIARGSMEFEPSPDARQPAAWSSDRVADMLTDQADAIRECKGGSSGAFEATVYVEPKTVEPDADAGPEAGPEEVGAALSVGVTPSDEAGAANVDCLVQVLLQATYASPGSALAKVTFRL